jgi:hypothetical protein
VTDLAFTVVHHPATFALVAEAATIRDTVRIPGRWP